MVNIVNMVPVSFGDSVKVVDEDGSLNITSNGHGAPDGCFQIGMDNFDPKQVGNAVVGLGINEGGSEALTTSISLDKAGFNVDIQPSQTWCVTTGNYQQGSIIDQRDVGMFCEIDMNKFPSGQVTVVHRNDGELSIQQ